MDSTKQTFPKWSQVTPERVAEELPRLLDEAEAAVAAIERSQADTYEGVVVALNDAMRPFGKCWGQVCHMLSVVNSESWRKVKADLLPKVVAFSLRVEQSRPLYEALRRVQAAGIADPVRRRIVEKSIQSAELSGVALEGAAKDRFNEVSSRLAELATEFSDCVLDATNAFSYEKDGVKYTIDDANYVETMKTCPDREVRERLARARALRAPENAARIDEILRLRKESAGLLGFEDYVSYSLATKCAPSVVDVFAMIDGMDAATKEKGEEEDAELIALAGSIDEPIDRVEPWDRAYLAEKLRVRKYDYSEEELKRHFYMDPYVRNGEKTGGAWMNDFEGRDDRRGTKPLALIVLNFKVPDAEGKTYLSMRDVETLFHEFGHALQCMLTRIGEEGAAGLALIEWDAVEVASQFMENWCLDDRTGISIPADLKAKVKAAKNFRAASMCRRQLAFSKIDMLLHGGGFSGDANALKNEMFGHFGVVTVDGDIFLNSFLHIFAGGYAAGYYGYKWSEVMSGDCYGAFEEAGLDDDEAVRRVGSEYRETILGLGGSMSAYDVFVKFRGRKPDPKPLLRQQGLA